MPELIDIKIPSLGESVAEATIAKWTKSAGQYVGADDIIVELETDKATIELPAGKAGNLTPLAAKGATVKVGDTIARIDTAGERKSPDLPPAPSVQPPAPSHPAAHPGAAAPPAPSIPERKSPDLPPAPPHLLVNLQSTNLDDLSPAVRALAIEHHLQSSQIPATGPNGRLTKEDVLAYIAALGEGGAPDAAAAALSHQTQAPEGVLSTLGTTNVPARSVASASSPMDRGPTPPALPAERKSPDLPPLAAPLSAPSRPLAPGEEREELSKLRQTLARRLVEAQHATASLTTFNEVDLSAIMALREKYKESFEKRHGIGLGFMSFFAKAVIYALKTVPQVNWSLDGNTLIKRPHVHLGVAVSTDRGLMVPVIRNAETLSMAQIESEIKRLANKARDGKITVDDMAGGTFTVTNGGVFGSLLSTPILNPPQAGILGMHKIEKRPIVVQENGKDVIAIRSMMYVALTYDHRLVDGRQSVTFLVKVKEALEDPPRMLLEV